MTHAAPGHEAAPVRPPALMLEALLLLFVAAAFVLPSEPAYALVFYLALGACALLGRRPHPRAIPRDPGAVLGLLLIGWSGLTLLWGHDDGHRSRHFAVGAAMTAAFFVLMLRAWPPPGGFRRLATVLIWCGAGNAVLSVTLGLLLPQDGPRLHGWGATSHPILGASVMSVAYLAAACRMLAEPRGRLAHAAAALAMAVFIARTESRGPALAALAATLFLCAAGPWRGRALGAVAVLAASWFLLPAGVRHHQANLLVQRGASHRFEIWHRTLELVTAHPILGNGLAANLDLPGMTFPHDLYLSVLFYSGAVGLLLFAGLLGVVTWRLWQGRRAGGVDWLWSVSLWISALLSGLTDLGQITKGPGPLWFIFWLPVGLALRARAPRLTPPAAA